MAAAILPRPGAPTGPCKQDCNHKDCAETRHMAAELCTHCHHPIGFGVRFYRDDDHLVHALCFEQAVEREMLLD
jgi:hypothetical protein